MPTAIPATKQIIPTMMVVTIDPSLLASRGDGGASTKIDASEMRVIGGTSCSDVCFPHQPMPQVARHRLLQ